MTQWASRIRGGHRDFASRNLGSGSTSRASGGLRAGLRAGGTSDDASRGTSDNPNDGDPDGRNAAGSCKRCTGARDREPSPENDRRTAATGVAYNAPDHRVDRARRRTVNPRNGTTHVQRARSKTLGKGRFGRASTRWFLQRTVLIDAERIDRDRLRGTGPSRRSTPGSSGRPARPRLEFAVPRAIADTCPLTTPIVVTSLHQSYVILCHKGLWQFIIETRVQMATHVSTKTVDAPRM